MPSPFPGTDPFLESPRRWPGLHRSLAVASAAQLNATLPQGFAAETEERLYVVRSGQEVLPDVSIVADPVARRVSERSGTVAVLERSAAGSATTAPLRVRVPMQTVREVYVVVFSVEEPSEVVTAIEFPSPTNKKMGEGRREYVQKQRDLFRKGIHLLEIDLLRAGRHTVTVPEEMVRAEYNHWDYLVSLRRGGGDEF